MYEQELQNLGLSEKEAKVYTTALELGPDTAQNIAKHAGINRATAYVQIDSLKKKGLMSEFSKGKKTFYTAENPEILSSLVNKEEVELNFKKLELAKVLPDLSKYFVKASKEGQRPQIRFFEGEEGVAQIRKDFLKTKNETIYGFINFDKVMQKLAKNQDQYTKNRIANNIHSKLIYTAKDGPKPELSGKTKKRDLKYIKTSKLDLDADITIYRDKVAFISYSSDTIGVIIQSREIANSMKFLFENIWKSLK